MRMNAVRKERADAFDRFEEQDARLRNFRPFPELKSQREIYAEHDEHKQRGRRVISLAALAVLTIVSAHLVMTGPVQDHIEAEVWADDR